MTTNKLDKQTITLSGQYYKSITFKGINRIDAYIHASNGEVAWNNDPYLGSSYSVNGSKVFYFSFADSITLFSSNFFALTDHSIPYHSIGYITLWRKYIRLNPSE